MEEDVVGEAAGEHVEDFGADGELAFPGKLGERDCVRLVVSWMRSGPGPAIWAARISTARPGSPGGGKKYFCQHESWFNEVSRLIQKHGLFFWRRRPVSALSVWSSQSLIQ